MLGVDLVIPDVTYIERAPREVPRHLHHPRPRGPHRRPALRPAQGQRADLLHAAHRRPDQRQAQGAPPPRRPPTSARILPGEIVKVGVFARRGLPGRPQHPGLRRLRHPHARRHRHPHRRLQARPHARHGPAHRPRPPRRARQRGRPAAPRRLDLRRGRGLHAVRADRRRGADATSSPTPGPRHRRDLRVADLARPAGRSTPPTPADARVFVTGRSMMDNVADGARARLPRRSRGDTSLNVNELRNMPHDEARHHHHRQPGRAHVRPHAHGQRRPPARPDRRRATPSSSPPRPSPATRRSSTAPSTTSSGSAPTCSTTASPTSTSAATPPRKS